MRGVEFGLPFDLHGIQCGAATVICLGIYKQLRDVKPDREKALAYVERFSYPAWAEKLHAWLGKSGDVMAANEARERKYDKELHRARLERIIAHWDGGGDKKCNPLQQGCARQIHRFPSDVGSRHS